jgi:hypothetical protein
VGEKAKIRADENKTRSRKGEKRVKIRRAEEIKRGGGRERRGRR